LKETIITNSEEEVEDVGRNLLPEELYGRGGEELYGREERNRAGRWLSIRGVEER
jgi:hypothetical protein